MCLMKRDMDLIREILLAAEAVQTMTNVSKLGVAETWSDQDVRYHLALLIEAGYVRAVSGPVGGDGLPAGFIVSRLTWEGHDFLDAIRDRTVWERTKTHLQKAGAGLMPVLIKEVAVAIIRAGIAQVVP